MDCMDCFLYPQDDKGQPCAQQVPFQEKNLDFLLKNLDFLIKNLDFMIKHRGAAPACSLRAPMGAAKHTMIALRRCVFKRLPSVFKRFKRVVWCVFMLKLMDLTVPLRRGGAWVTTFLLKNDRFHD